MVGQCSLVLLLPVGINFTGRFCIKLNIQILMKTIIIFLTKGFYVSAYFLCYSIGFDYFSANFGSFRSLRENLDGCYLKLITYFPRDLMTFMLVEDLKQKITNYCNSNSPVIKPHAVISLQI